MTGFYLKRSGTNSLREMRQFDHEYFVSDGGHVWSNWRLYLNTFAQKLFK